MKVEGSKALECFEGKDEEFALDPRRGRKPKCSVDPQIASKFLSSV